MKAYKLLLFVFLLFILSCSSKKNQKKSFVEKNIIHQDTFFIKRQFQDGQFYHAIYIDSTSSPASLTKLYGLDGQDSLNIKEYSDSLRLRKINLNKFETYGLASEWLPINRWNSTYYLYHPSDDGGKGHGIIADSIVLLYYMDGYTPYGIKSFSKKSENIFAVTFASYNEWQDEHGLIDLNIYIIDRAKMLTIWEYKFKGDKEYTYELMVPKEYAKYYSIIVNDSVEKQREVVFETIDFKALLGRVK